MWHARVLSEVMGEDGLLIDQSQLDFHFAKDGMWKDPDTDIETYYWTMGAGATPIEKLELEFYTEDFSEKIFVKLSVRDRGQSSCSQNEMDELIN